MGILRGWPLGASMRLDELGGCRGPAAPTRTGVRGGEPDAVRLAPGNALACWACSAAATLDREPAIMMS